MEKTERIKPLKDLNTDFRIRRINYGYAEDYDVVVLPTEENLTKIVEKINEIIKRTNQHGKR